MGKRVSCYLNDSDLQLLNDFCKTHDCSQSAALKSALLHLKVESAPKPGDPLSPQVHPGEFVFHEGLLDREKRLEKEAREKRLADARAAADKFISEATDPMDRVFRESSVHERIKELLGGMKK